MEDESVRFLYIGPRGYYKGEGCIKYFKISSRLFMITTLLQYFRRSSLRLLKIQLQNCQVNAARKEQHPALTRHKTLPLLTAHTNNTHSEDDVTVNCHEEPHFLCLNAIGFTYFND
jgi:hypothetical protein